MWRGLFPLTLLGCETGALGTRFAYCILKAHLQNETKQGQANLKDRHLGIEMGSYYISFVSWI